MVPSLAQAYRLAGGGGLHLRLGGAHQLQNASLAVSLLKSHFVRL